MTLTEHLVELRIRLIRCAWAVLIGIFATFHYAEYVFNYIRKPIEKYLPDGGLIYTGPLDKFLAFVKIAVVFGFIVVLPYILYQIWQFIAPGLYKNERKYAVGFIGFGTFMFALGAAFSYFVVLPMAFKFLMTFGGETDKPMIAIDSYLNFFTQTCLVFGLAFELPLIITTLGMIGVVSQKFLREKRKYAVMGIAVACAIITPPDALSMILMLIPMTALYELSIILVGFFERRKMKSYEALDGLD
jgi:sec-independent protein translocase protein TatC